MLVECIFNSGKDLPVDSRCLNEADETDYSFLEIGMEYIVYGVIFYPCRIDYLVCPNKGNPIWIPANLCKIKNNKLSPSWSICVTNLNEEYKILYESFKIQSIMGYSELVTSISHYVGIIEREANDMEKFFLEKEKMDKELTYVFN